MSIKIRTYANTSTSHKLGRHWYYGYCRYLSLAQHND